MGMGYETIDDCKWLTLIEFVVVGQRKNESHDGICPGDDCETFGHSLISMAETNLTIHRLLFSAVRVFLSYFVWNFYAVRIVYVVRPYHSRRWTVDRLMLINHTI